MAQTLQHSATSPCRMQSWKGPAVSHFRRMWSCAAIFTQTKPAGSNWVCISSKLRQHVPSAVEQLCMMVTACEPPVTYMHNSNCFRIDNPSLLAEHTQDVDSKAKSMPAAIHRPSLAATCRIHHTWLTWCIQTTAVCLQST